MDGSISAPEASSGVVETAAPEASSGVVETAAPEVCLLCGLVR